MHLFTWFDYVIMVVISISMLVSLMRGFVREALSLLTWAIAFWVSFNFSGVLANLLTGHVDSGSLREIIAFAVLFGSTLLLGAFVNHLIAQVVDNTGLSGTDRIIGVIFGFARGVLVVALLLMLAHLTPMPRQQAWKKANLIPLFQPLELRLHDLLPKTVAEHLMLSY